MLSNRRYIIDKYEQVIAKERRGAQEKRSAEKATRPRAERGAGEEKC